VRPPAALPPFVVHLRDHGPAPGTPFDAAAQQPDLAAAEAVRANVTFSLTTGRTKSAKDATPYQGMG